MYVMGMTKPLLVDRFCGEGGAAAGYVRAGFRVWGVDNNPKLRDRYLMSGAERFICADAMTWIPDEEPAAEHASPPCGDHSPTMQFGLAERGTGWMLQATIKRLRAWNGVWVVENVEGADMPVSLVLCGSEFGLRAEGRILRRHRQFLSNVFMLGAGGCYCRGRKVGGVYGHGPQRGARGYGFAADAAREAMQMPWGSRDGVAQAIPPPYTAFIGEQLMTYIKTAA